MRTPSSLGWTSRSPPHVWKDSEMSCHSASSVCRFPQGHGQSESSGTSRDPAVEGILGPHEDESGVPWVLIVARGFAAHRP
jgi:hypothetical protein